jgi:hypothetical protein
MGFKEKMHPGRGFTTEFMVELGRAELASAEPERMMAAISRTRGRTCGSPYR